MKKYVSSKVDDVVLLFLLDEAELIRSGGRRNIDGRSIYEAPASPMLQLVFFRSTHSTNELTMVLESLKPLLKILAGVKTQREIIHSKIGKHVDSKNTYHAFVEVLNRARGLDVISADERRALEKKWRENPDDRAFLEDDLKKRIGPN